MFKKREEAKKDASSFLYGKYLRRLCYVGVFDKIKVWQKNIYINFYGSLPMSVLMY